MNLLNQYSKGPESSNNIESFFTSFEPQLSILLNIERAFNAFLDALDIFFLGTPSNL